MVKQWYHFDSTEMPARISVEAVDEETARICLKFVLTSHLSSSPLKFWKLDGATYNRDGSPIL